MSVKYKVVITDQQKTVKIPKGLRMLIRRSCIAVLQNEKVDTDTLVNVVFVDNQRISELNKAYFRSDEVVPGLIVKEEDGGSIGCIFISVEKSVELAEQHLHTLEYEIGYTVVHGVLKLVGNEPETEVDETHLRDRGEYIMYLLGLPSSSAYALNTEN
ncbi:MAG TPA: rRNA maturation RNase YbeY [Ruminococcaceae bacterium]|nr:rRNA maturation RNase YbeY [Oscillospiraceae bacterium]